MTDGQLQGGQADALRARVEALDAERESLEGFLEGDGCAHLTEGERDVLLARLTAIRDEEQRLWEAASLATLRAAQHEAGGIPLGALAGNLRDALKGLDAEISRLREERGRLVKWIAGAEEVEAERAPVQDLLETPVETLESERARLDARLRGGAELSSQAWCLLLGDAVMVDEALAMRQGEVTR